MDPSAEAKEQIDKSPYAYGWNSPVRYNDPDGRCPECEETFENPTEGQRYTSSGGAYYSYSGGNWTRSGGTLDEVTVTPDGVYASGPYSFASDNRAGFGLFSAGARHGGKNGSTALNFAGYSGEAQFDNIANMSASTSMLKGSLKTDVDFDSFGASGEVSGNLLSADAGVSAKSYGGVNGKIGVGGKIGAGAYVAKGELTGGFSFGSFQFELTQGGSLGSAHAGIEGNAYFNRNSGTTVVEGSFNFGFGAGYKSGFKLQLPPLLQKK